jgi:ubiquinone/menaquinone biosynthesis C-methylase UbiE
MEKLIKAYQHLRSGVYFVEALPLVGVNVLLKNKKNRHKVGPQDIESLRKHVDGLFRYDTQCIEEGIYPVSVLKPGNPVAHFKNLQKVYIDVLKVAYRRLNKKTKSFSKDAQKFAEDLPEYYQRNFHFQTDGYLGETSAQIYDHQVELLFKGTAHAMRRLFLKDMKRHFGSRSNKKINILEIAVGTGSATEFILKTFPEARITCLDPSPTYIKMAQENLKKHSNVNFVQGLGEDLHFKDETFDAVVSTFLFHELPKEIREKVIQESLRVLKPNGYLGLADSVQIGDIPELDWTIEEFPIDFHEPYYTNYIKNPMEDLISKNPGVELIRKRLGFLTKALSYKKV